MTEIYLMTTEEADRIPEEECRELFPARMERADRFRFREDRLRSIGAGFLLSRVLGVREKDLMYGPHGKPSCPACGKEFSLSHSGELILLAVSDRPVGADIEKIGEIRRNVARRVFLPEELNWMEGDKTLETERFYRLWTLKESVMKALGRGFSLSPESFSVLPLLKNGAGRAAGAELQAFSGMTGGYALGVCTAASARRKTAVPEVRFFGSREETFAREGGYPPAEPVIWK